MTDKTYKIIIALLVIIIIGMGIYIYGCHTDLTLGDYFDKSNDYSSEWDDTTKVITVEKVFPLKFNQTYENVSTEITFYKDSSKISNVSVVNDTHDGKLVVYTETKLSEEPNNIEFDIVYGDLVESDNEGLEYSRNFHLF